MADLETMCLYRWVRFKLEDKCFTTNNAFNKNFIIKEYKAVFSFCTQTLFVFFTLEELPVCWLFLWIKSNYLHWEETTPFKKNRYSVCQKVSHRLFLITKVIGFIMFNEQIMQTYGAKQ